MAIHLVTYLVLLPTARTLGMGEFAFVIIITSSTFGGVLSLPPFVCLLLG